MSWAQKYGFEDEEHKVSELDMQSVDASTSVGDLTMIPAKHKLSREERERFRFINVKKLKVFTCVVKVNGKMVNIVVGLELRTGVISAKEQKEIVEHIYELQEKGRKGELRERTYSAPLKWMRGKGRVTIQFGCCYNCATDKAGNPPGILQQEDVDPISSLFKTVLVLKGNRADVAKHCIPAVPRKRISIMFRKIDQSKTPVGFISEPDLQEIKPTTLATTISSSYPTTRRMVLELYI